MPSATTFSRVTDAADLISREKTDTEQTVNSSKRLKTAPHEDHLKSSLDSALDLILATRNAGIPGRTLTATPRTLGMPRTQALPRTHTLSRTHLTSLCSRCRSPAESGRDYRIHCGHVICRSCLVQIDFRSSVSPSSASLTGNASLTGSDDLSASAPICAECQKPFAQKDVALNHDFG